MPASSMNSFSHSQMIPLPEKVNNTHKSYAIAITSFILCITCSLMVVVRLACKFHIRALAIEDYVIIPGLLLNAFLTAILIRTNLHGAIGTVPIYITYNQIKDVYQCMLVNAWIYPAMTTSMRISILLFYRRLFSTAMSSMDKAIWILVCLQIVYLVVFSILPGVLPEPLYLLWKPRMVLHNQIFYYYYAYLQLSIFTVSLAFDLALLILPFFPIITLRLPIRKRIGMVFMFTLGAAACFAAAIKLGIFVIGYTIEFDADPDWSKHEVSLYIPNQFKSVGKAYWYVAQVEPTLALGGSSLPAIRNWIMSLRKPSNAYLERRQAYFRRQYHTTWFCRLHRTHASEIALYSDDYSDESLP